MTRLHVVATVRQDRCGRPGGRTWYCSGSATARSVPARVSDQADPGP
jgi:hypothetical protein